VPRTVLLVDDDLAEIALVKRVLERGRHEALVATNASDAWLELERGSKEVLLLAPECDGGEGAELARRLTGGLGTRPVALVVLGAAVEGVLARVVARPIDEVELEEALEQAGGATASSSGGPLTPALSPAGGEGERPTSTSTATRTPAPPRPAVPRLAFDQSPSPFEEASELRAAERDLWLAQERERNVPPPLERAVVEEKLRLVQRADYFDILGIGPDCSAEEVRQAVARLLTELHTERCPPDDAVLRGQVDEIRRVISEAGAALGDDSLRGQYRRAVGR